MALAYLNWRLQACAVHGLRYNGEHSGCPVCRDEHSVYRLAAATQWAGRPRFPCPYCGGRSIYEGGCSRFACRKKAGKLKPRFLLNRCVHCGSKTKYATSCTRYRCRQREGTIGLYYRRK